LGVNLPPDYKSFILITNGWPLVGFNYSSLLEINMINKYSILHYESYKIWRTVYDEEPLTNRQRLVYGADQLPELYAHEDLDEAIAISDNEYGECILLNPLVKNNGNYETWVISPRHPDAMRFPSFFAFMFYASANVKSYSFD